MQGAYRRENYSSTTINVSDFANTGTPTHASTKKTAVSAKIHACLQNKVNEPSPGCLLSLDVAASIYLVIVRADIARSALAVVDAGGAEAGHDAAAPVAQHAADGVGEAAEQGSRHAGGEGGVGLCHVDVVRDGLGQIYCEREGSKGEGASSSGERRAPRAWAAWTG